MAQDFLDIPSNATADTQVKRIMINTSDEFETFKESRPNKSVKLKEINNEFLCSFLKHLKKKEFRLVLISKLFTKIFNAGICQIR